MREFFRPFRRKLGALVLVGACGLMTGWVRSEFICDGIVFSGPSFMAIGHGSIVLVNGEGGSTDAWRFPVWEKGNINLFESDLRTVLWQWRLMGFGKGQLPEGPKLSIWTVPYWSLVLPLTLLSAWLLLGTPRNRMT